MTLAGLDENAYFHGRGQAGDGDEEEGVGSGEVAKRALAVIYEILTGEVLFVVLVRRSFLC